MVPLWSLGAAVVIMVSLWRDCGGHCGATVATEVHCGTLRSLLWQYCVDTVGRTVVTVVPL